MKLSGVDELFSRIYRLQDQLEDPLAPLELAGELIEKSIKTNIDVGGRPAAYTPLAASTIAARARRGTGSKPLYDTGEMYGGITHIVQGDSVETGSDAGQAKRLHFGYPGHVGPGGSRTPARPFVMVQPEDHDPIKAIFATHYAS